MTGRRLLAVATLATLAAWPWLAPPYFVFLASVILINVVVVFAMRRLERRLAVPGFIGGGAAMPQAGH